MRERKMVLGRWYLYDRSGMIRFFEKQARKGWMLEHSDGMFWTFRRCEPQELHYAILYYPKATEFDLAPTEEQQILNDFCAQTGWEWVTAKGYIQVFCNKHFAPCPIQTDPTIDLENIHQAMKAKSKTSWLLLLACLLNIFLRVFSLLLGGGSIASQNSDKMYLIHWTVFLVVAFQDYVQYFFWRHRAKKSISEGNDLPDTRTNLICYHIMLVVLAFSLFFTTYVFLPSVTFGMFIGTIFISILTVFLVFYLIKIQKTKDGSVKKKRAIVVGISTSFVTVFAIIMALVTIAASDSVSSNAFLNKCEEVRHKIYVHTCRFLGFEREPVIHLQAEDVLDGNLEGYTQDWVKEEFETHTEYMIYFEDGEENPAFCYVITEPKEIEYYDQCLNEILEDAVFSYNQIDETWWSAKQAYERRILPTYLLEQGEKGERIKVCVKESFDISVTLTVDEYESLAEYCDENEYALSTPIAVGVTILCYEDHIVELFYDLDLLSNEQKAIIGEKLSCLP